MVISLFTYLLTILQGAIKIRIAMSNYHAVFGDPLARKLRRLQVQRVSWQAGARMLVSPIIVFITCMLVMSDFRKFCNAYIDFEKCSDISRVFVQIAGILAVGWSAFHITRSASLAKLWRFHGGHEAESKYILARGISCSLVWIMVYLVLIPIVDESVIKPLLLGGDGRGCM